ncbi:nitrilase-related carbon-nitrogen hydrolase [Pinirhizobacter soli]|uniref:nitrilase-related carbon-nitrogen hydrolase n=1 Tax=Pinirhizobacter soli TaxID=2786953 RepID=UPI00202A9A2E|nr:nitrilase-related carbon-nitrogen hydrolase [Pinirhizobacter soli]
MASRLERFLLPVGCVAAALSALAWWFGSGLEPLWWLTWVAPLPVLMLAPRVRARWAILAALLAYALGSFNLWDYFHTYIKLPPPVVAYIIGMPGVMLAVCVWLFRRLLLRGRVLAAALATPVLWVALEYANNLVSPHGTFGSIAYTQIEALGVIQVAAVGGIWAISFLLLLVPTVVAVQTWQPATRQSRFGVAALGAVLLASTLVYGALRLQTQATDTIRVGLVSLEKPIRPMLDDAEGRDLVNRYVEAIGKLADAGARVVVIPETSFTTTQASIPALAELATQRKLILGAGIDLKDGAGHEHNMLTVFHPGSQSPAMYSKHHLIPGFEQQYAPGNSYTQLAGSPRIGLAVCKDLDFQDTGRAYAALRTQLLLVPAWDFGADGWLHGRMAIMRSVEGGFAMARAARRGRLTLSDDRGRVVAEASSEQHDASLVGNLPLYESRTLYGRWGDWFAWLDLIILAACLAMSFLPARDTAASPAASAA